MSGQNERWLEWNEGEGAHHRARWPVGAPLARAAIELAALLVLARLLLPEEFGTVGMVAAVTGLLVVFKDRGLSTRTVWQAEIAQSEVSALCLLNIGAGVVLTLLCAALAPVLSMFYGEEALVDVTLVMAATFVIGSFGTQHRALLRRQREFGRIATIEVAAAVVGIGAGVGAAVAGWGYWALVVRAIVSEVIGAIASWVLCSWRPSAPRFDDRVRELVGFDITASGVAEAFSRQFDAILIGRLFGAAALGFYLKAGELLTGPLRGIHASVGALARPALGELDPASERHRRAFLRVFERLLLVTSFVGGVLCGTADWVVVIVLGEQWLPSAPIFAWLALLVFTQPVTTTASWLFASQDRARALSRWRLAASALAALSFIVGLNWGAVGVAASYAISGVLVRTPLLVWLATRSGPVTFGDMAKATFPFLSAGAAVISTVVALRVYAPFESSVEGFVASCGAAFLAYGVFMLAIPSCRAAVVDSFGGSFRRTL